VSSTNQNPLRMYTMLGGADYKGTAMILVTTDEIWVGNWIY
jgi:hypothetical protein